MKQSEFESFISDTSKIIEGDISWSEDEDHSPSSEFRVEVQSEAGYPVFVRGSYNPLISALTFAIIHRQTGRIYALDMGKDHHNPTCQNVGNKHKHRWTERFRDKEAYVPSDITAPVTDPSGVWKQFCTEANIIHNGKLLHPPPLQMEMFI